MLKDAALLQLDLLLAALNEAMTLKDASAFNFQWMGSRPVFIDIPSFERLKPGSPGPVIGSSASCSYTPLAAILQRHSLSALVARPHRWY